MTDEAYDDVNQRWTLLRPERTKLFASNVPPWLQDAIRQGAAISGGPCQLSRQMGSDHLTFAQAGVVSTNVAVGGGSAHTADDTISNVNAGSMELAVASHFRSLELLSCEAARAADASKLPVCRAVLSDRTRMKCITGQS
jgi:hypothetical protein